jgi:HSP20 family protein
MSWDDPDDETRRKLRRWFGDFLPEDVFRQIEEMMNRMMNEMNEGTLFDSEAFEEMLRNPESTSPFVFGFSMKVGPDGKPIIQRFGNPPMGDGSEGKNQGNHPYYSCRQSPETLPQRNRASIQGQKRGS